MADAETSVAALIEAKMALDAVQRRVLELAPQIEGASAATFAAVGHVAHLAAHAKDLVELDLDFLRLRENMR